MAVDKKVDVKYYLERRFNDPYDKEREVQPFYMKSIHDFYKNFSESWTLLEFGGGPWLYTLISAGPLVSKIVFVDYDQTGPDDVMAWKNNSEDSHDWSPYFEYVISELEGVRSGMKEMSVMRQKELKRKITQFVRSDIRAKHIFDHKFDGEKFDIISSNFCLDAVTETRGEFQYFVKRISQYVKPGGFLVGLVSLEETFWYTSHMKVKPHLLLTEEDVTEAFKMAGFAVKFSVVTQVRESARFKLNDCKALMFIVGKLSSTV